MAARRKDLTPKGMILAVTDANGGTIEGRTALQKICYFAAERLGVEFGFGPHYYGPFSPKVEDATDLLVSQNLLRETIERLPTHWPKTGFEARKYTYELTDRGKQYISKHRLRSLKSFHALGELLESLREMSDLNPSILSGAAKIHFIVASENRPLSNSEIKKRAKDIGWKLAGGDIDKIADLLVSLNLLEGVN